MHFASMAMFVYLSYCIYSKMQCAGFLYTKRKELRFLRKDLKAKHDDFI